MKNLAQKDYAPGSQEDAAQCLGQSAVGDFVLQRGDDLG